MNSSLCSVSVDEQSFITLLNYMLAGLVSPLLGQSSYYSTTITAFCNSAIVLEGS
jgi:hypothetical protein